MATSLHTAQHTAHAEISQIAVLPHTLTSTASPSATSLTLLASDLVASAAAMGCAVLLWNRLNPSIAIAGLPEIWAPLALLPLVFACFGLYSPAGIEPVEELRRAVLGSLLVDLVLTAAVFLMHNGRPVSRGTLVGSLLFSIVLVPLSRGMTRLLFAGKPWWGVPVLILGAGETARLLIHNLRAQPDLGLKPVACLDDDEAKQGYCAGVAVAGPLSMASDIAGPLKIRHTLIAMPGVERQQFLRILEKRACAFPHVIVIPNLFGMASLWISARDLGGVLGLELRQNLLIPANQCFKRVMDLALGAVMGVVSLPILALAALWIRIVSPGSPFYRQERGGQGGRTIGVWKLRTMYSDAEPRLQTHLERSADASEEWGRFFKLKNDPRILPGIGKILRRTSLDELPQIWNILKGEMSLVGPRPFPRYHLDHFHADFCAFRNKVRPGLTGLWQVSARSNGDLSVQEALDSYYIRNWSLWLDVYLLARTVRAVMFRRGAY